MSQPQKRPRLSSPDADMRGSRKREARPYPSDQSFSSDQDDDFDDSEAQIAGFKDEGSPNSSEIDETDGEEGSGDSYKQDEEQEEAREEELKKNLRHISFGALVEAQTSLHSTSSSSQSRERPKALRSLARVRPFIRPEPTQDSSSTNPQVQEAEEKVARLRARLAELRGLKKRKSTDKPSANSHTSRSTYAASAEPAHSTNKSKHGKHAPTEQTSTRPVSRKRQAVDTSNLHSSYTSSSASFGAGANAQRGRGHGRKVASNASSRDPRFSSLSGPVNVAAHAKNYAFLNEYRANEISVLQSALSSLQAKNKKNKKKKTAKEQPTSRPLDDEQEQKQQQLRRTLDSLTNKQKSVEREARLAKVKREHRAAERQAVREGKKARPWFLKANEVKRRAERDRTKDMSAKQIESGERKRLVRREKKDRRRLTDLEDVQRRRS